MLAVMRRLRNEDNADEETSILQSNEVHDLINAVSNVRNNQAGEALSYEDSTAVSSVSVESAKEIIRRIMRVQKSLKTLKQRLGILNGIGSSGELLTSSGDENTEGPLTLLQQYAKLQLFLWGHLAKLFHDEHQRCVDVYSRTLSLQDRVPFETLIATVHRNTPFCDYMGEVIDTAFERNILRTEVGNSPMQDALVKYVKIMEKIQVIATYTGLLVVEGSRESFLDPMPIQDLCKAVVEEKKRLKRLIPLSLTFTMLEQDDQAVSEAFFQRLPHVLLQRLRHLAHQLFGYPENGELVHVHGVKSPFRYYSAIIQSHLNSPLSSRRASPEIAPEGTKKASCSVNAVKCSESSKNPESPQCSATGFHEQTSVCLRQESTVEMGAMYNQEDKTICKNDIGGGHKPIKRRKLETMDTLVNNRESCSSWEPMKGEKVGRGPSWHFYDQGNGCDMGEVVDVSATEEVLVRWSKSIDSKLKNDASSRIFRYKYRKPYEQVVSWNRFLNTQTMKVEDINIRLEEFMLNCAVAGALGHQKESVLPALQFQTIETMIHVLDKVNLSYTASVVATMQGDGGSEEGVHKNETSILFDSNTTIDTYLCWDEATYFAKEQYRRNREIVARVGWLLNSLLAHKKLALVFLELGGLQRIMRFSSDGMESAITYSCCIVLSPLARGIVFENLLRFHGDYFESVLKFILHQWQNASSHDVQASAGGFLFHALSFPPVIVYFDAHQGPQITLSTLERLLQDSEERSDVICPGVALAALKCAYVYLVSHLMLSTRVIFRKHRLLSVLVTNSSQERSLPRDPATIESVLGLLATPLPKIPDISIETIHSFLARDRLAAFRFLVDNNFHQLLLRCVQFYFSQSRWELLIASLNVLCVLTVVPFVRPLVADARYPDSGVVHLIMIVSELTSAFQNGNASRESHLIPCAATALQILLHLACPPTDKSDEVVVSTFNRICGVIRASDGVRTLLEVLRIRKDGTMSAKLQLFPVVARALQLMVALRRYADTQPLFDALGVSVVARELLAQYDDVQKEYLSMMNPHYSASDAQPTGRFMENIKCFLFDEKRQEMPTISMDAVELEQRQAIIARSCMNYSRESLLELISRHLESEGLQDAAAVIRRDALLAADGAALPQSNSFPLDHAPSTIGAPTLDGIIRSYLRQQHERCTNPIATLPEFDLRKSHVYYPLEAPVDQTRNAFNRRLARKMGLDFTLRTMANESHLIYRYPGYLFDITGEGDDLQGNSIAFCDNGDVLIVGTSEGGIALFDAFPDNSTSDKLLEQHLVFDNDGVQDISVSRDGTLLAAISTDHKIAVMSRSELPVTKFNVEGSRAAMFSRCNAYLLTTCDEQHTCRLYDLGSQSEVRHFSDPSWVGENLNNVATFDATSQLVLSDAVLWDVRCGDKPIYRFDRFTESFCNAFHPFNPLVMIDEKVWDLRTLTMLKTVPCFRNSTSFHTNPLGRVIYSFRESSTLPESPASVLSAVESYTFGSVFSTELRPAFRAFAIDPSDRYCAAILEKEAEAVVRVFSASSGPLPGHRTFPLPQDDLGHEGDEELGDNEDDEEIDNGSFWSSVGDAVDEDDDEDDEDDDDDDDDDNEDEDDDDDDDDDGDGNDNFDAGDGGNSDDSGSDYEWEGDIYTDDACSQVEENSSVITGENADDWEVGSGTIASALGTNERSLDESLDST
ncbi:hypothetical protein ERJ75_000332800 [Trypanosoma vivax]|uniref:Uncharacterized protein n=1 Tax=Trypanosoma vivax (strain Y486) TaxID=1055687 RepID=G0UAL0_TRYVY|nr:hypothetical protein ERJ75_000332800 [Trypanosoma vivax]CCC52843.1 conserved hypothetical protein [Trypanosoma vivax Y486]